MAKWPQTSRDDVKPEKWSNAKKKMGEHFDHAMNKPNCPKCDPKMEVYNVNEEYCPCEEDE